MPRKPRKKKPDGPVVARMHLAPYGAELIVVFHDDMVEVADHSGVDSSSVDGRGGFYAFIGDDERHLIALNTQGLCAGAICHEAMHCVFGIMREIGQPLEGAEEPVAYLLQHVFDSCIKAAARQGIGVDPEPGM